MSSLVSEKHMEDTWQRVSRMSSSQVLRIQQSCGRDQQELAGFVIGYTSTMPPQDCGLVLYVYAVLAEAFRSTNAKFRKLSPARIVNTWNESQKAVSLLQETGRALATSVVSSSREPAAMQYVLDALSEDQEDPVELSDDHYRHAVAILRTVVECMHFARKSA